MPMRINVLGTLTDDNRDLHCSPRAAVLLASLAFADSPVPRSALLERLWPLVKGQVPKARSDGNLDGYTTEARSLLGESKKALYANKGTHSLVLYRPGAQTAPATVTTDVYDFQRLKQSHDPANLEAALSIVRGPVLASLDERAFPWLEQMRLKFNIDCQQILRKLYNWPTSHAESLR